VLEPLLAHAAGQNGTDSATSLGDRLARGRHLAITRQTTHAHSTAGLAVSGFPANCVCYRCLRSWLSRSTAKTRCRPSLLLMTIPRFR
jgi:hypothetical protein